MIRGLAADDLRDLTLSVGTHRGTRRLSPLEVGRLIEQALAAGTSRQDCLLALGIGPSQLGIFLRLLTLTPEIQHFADWGGTKNASIPFSTLAELARLSPQDQVTAAEAVLRHGLRWKEVVQLSQIAHRSEESIEECLAKVLRLRPQIETQHVFLGAVTSDSLRLRLKSLLQLERDQLFQNLLRRLVGPAYSIRGRLGTTEFTIMSKHDLPRLLNLTADDLEGAVNTTLEELVSKA